MRRFGVEVEFGGSRSAALTAIHRAGLGPATEHNYMGHSDTHWIVKSDASVSGGELVSPPLDFDDPDQRAQVDRAIAALTEAGCTTDPSAGIHVHIESRDMDAKQVAAVGRLFAKFEDAIYRLASSGWNTMRPGATSYARRLTDSQKTGIARARNEAQLKRAYYGSDSTWHRGHGDPARYCGLNLHSHFYRGTIEFRVFNSSMNAERVQCYIAVCIALVQDARNGKVRSITKSYNLGDMLSGRAEERKVIFNFLQVLRYEAGMSLEDYRRVKRYWKASRPQARTAA